jgi:hypothetical protein
VDIFLELTTEDTEGHRENLLWSECGRGRRRYERIGSAEESVGQPRTALARRGRPRRPSPHTRLVPARRVSRIHTIRDTVELEGAWSGSWWRFG